VGAHDSHTQPLSRVQQISKFATSRGLLREVDCALQAAADNETAQEVPDEDGSAAGNIRLHSTNSETFA
jgi:hypothetical protein